MFCRPIGALAATVIAPVEVTVAPAPTVARFEKMRTFTPIDAATAVSDFPPAAARPQTMMSFRSPVGVTASTVTPTPVTMALAPIRALLLTMTTFSPTAAPTFFEPDEPPDPPPEPPPEPPPDPPLEPPDPPVSSDRVGILMIVAVPFAVASVWFCALMITAPVRAVTVRPSAIRAVFVEMTTFTLIAAATPVPPDEVPD